MPESTDIKNRRLNLPNKVKMRNLHQYKNMSDEEYDEVYDKMAIGIEYDKNFEKKIQEKIDSFGESYDLDDLNSNDKLSLRALAQAYINLEDYDQMLNTLKIGGVTASNILLLEKLNSICTNLRKDISNLQNDLMITRSKRESTKNQSVLSFIEDLKSKAKEFYDQRMSYIFCPKCNMLLGTIWTQFPLDDRNKITLVCGRRHDDGTTCGEKVVVRTADLVESKGTNKVEILPESMR